MTLTGPLTNPDATFWWQPIKKKKIISPVREERNLFEEYLKTYIGPTNKVLCESTIIQYSQVIGKMYKNNVIIDDKISVTDFVINETQGSGNYNPKKMKHDNYNIKRNNNYVRAAVIAYMKFKYQKNKEMYNKMIESLPVPNVYNPDGQNYKRPDPLVLNRDIQFDIIRKLQSDKHKLIAMICLAGALRTYDVFNIKRDNVLFTTIDDKEVCVIKVKGKGNKVRTIYIYIKNVINSLQQFMNKYNYGSEYLFLEIDSKKNKAHKGCYTLNNTEDLNGKIVSKDRSNDKKYIRIINKCIKIDIEQDTVIAIRDIQAGIDYKQIELMFTEDFKQGNIKWEDYNSILFIDDKMYKIFRYNYRRFLHDWKTAVRSNGIDIERFNPHDIKRSFASINWDKFHDLIMLKEELGHTRLETTNIYLRRTSKNKALNDYKSQEDIKDPNINLSAI